MLGLDVQAAADRAGDAVIALSRAELDIADAGAVTAALDRARPDVVVNCAAYTRVDDAEDDVAGATRVNAEGPGVLAAAAASVSAWMVHVSTDYVFDGAKTSGPYVESDVTGPRSVYGSTKLAGERAVAAAAPDRHTIVRSAWLFGTGGPCFPATILRAAATRPLLRVVDDQVGSPTYTPHLAEALLSLAAERVVGVTHVAAAGTTSWFGFASALVAAASGAGGGGALATVSPCTTAEFPRPAPRPAFSVLRSERPEVPGAGGLDGGCGGVHGGASQLGWGSGGGGVMRILVTGGAGFIGSNFVRFVHRERPEWEIVVYDLLTYAGDAGNVAGLSERVSLVQADICDGAALDAALAGVDAVVHFAAESHNDNSLHSPWPFVQTNVVGTYTILEAVRRHGVRLHHISTDEVYGDLELDDPSRFVPETPYNPSSPYSATKGRV